MAEERGGGFRSLANYCGSCHNANSWRLRWVSRAYMMTERQAFRSAERSLPMQTKSVKPEIIKNKNKNKKSVKPQLFPVSGKTLIVTKTMKSNTHFLNLADVADYYWPLLGFSVLYLLRGGWSND